MKGTGIAEKRVVFIFSLSFVCYIATSDLSSIIMKTSDKTDYKFVWRLLHKRRITFHSIILFVSFGAFRDIFKMLLCRLKKIFGPYSVCVVRLLLNHDACVEATKAGTSAVTKKTELPWDFVTEALPVTIGTSLVIAGP